MKNFLQGLTLAAAITVSCFVATPVVFTACTTSQQRISYNSLYSVGKSVDVAYRSYLDLVLAGKVKTNSVPAISKQYNEFQQAFGAAVVVLTLNTNAPASTAITAQASELIGNIAKAKEAK